MQTDYNNDGHMDVYFVRGAWLGEMGLIPDSLLRNNGDGTYRDVTRESGIPGEGWTVNLPLSSVSSVRERRVAWLRTGMLGAAFVAGWIVVSPIGRTR